MSNIDLLGDNNSFVVYFVDCGHGKWGSSDISMTLTFSNELYTVLFRCLRRLENVDVKKNHAFKYTLG